VLAQEGHSVAFGLQHFSQSRYAGGRISALPTTGVNLYTDHRRMPLRQLLASPAPFAISYLVDWLVPVQSDM